MNKSFIIALLKVSQNKRQFCSKIDPEGISCSLTTGTCSGAEVCVKLPRSHDLLTVNGGKRWEYHLCRVELQGHALAQKSASDYPVTTICSLSMVQSAGNTTSAKLSYRDIVCTRLPHKQRFLLTVIGAKLCRGRLCRVEPQGPALRQTTP